MSLKNSFVNGVLWNGIGRFASLGIQFIVSIILARLLGPYAYGVIGILTVFISVSHILIDSGFGQALIQSGKSNNVDYSSIFFLNIFIGIVLYGILFLLAPYIGAFYNIDGLDSYSRWIFLVIPINALGIIPRTILQKELKFREISLIECFASIISGAVGIFAAYKGLGIYSLIIQIIVINVVRTSFSMIVRRWIPSLQISLSTIRELFPFGINLMLTGLLTVVFNNIHTLIIGKFYAPKDVGYYNQSKQYEQITSNTVTDIVMGVTFPTLVKYKNDTESLRVAYKKIIECVVFLVAPLMIGLMTFSEELFEVILTKKWLPAVPYFQILCLYGATFPLHQINGNILKVLGKSRTLLYVELFRRFVLIISIILTIKISIEALLIGQAISMLFVIIVSMRYSGKLINYQVINQIKDISIYYIISIIVAVLAFYIKLSINMDALTTIIFMTIFISALYMFGCKICKASAFINMASIVKEKISKK